MNYPESRPGAGVLPVQSQQGVWEGAAIAQLFSQAPGESSDNSDCSDSRDSSDSSE